jgi:hypothetical protein
MDLDRDRSWLATAEIAIAVGLLVATQLPWWLVTPTTADRIPTGPSYSTGINGVGGASVTDADLAVLFGPPVVLVLVLLAGWLSRRGLVVLALIAFLSTGTVGALGLIDQSNAGLVDAFPTQPYVGLQLFAWLCLAGTIVTAVDLTWNGMHTALSRRRKRLQA